MLLKANSHGNVHPSLSKNSNQILGTFYCAARVPFFIQKRAYFSHACKIRLLAASCSVLLSSVLAQFEHVFIQILIGIQTSVMPSLFASTLAAVLVNAIVLVDSSVKVSYPKADVRRMCDVRQVTMLARVALRSPLSGTVFENTVSNILASPRERALVHLAANLRLPLTRNGKII